MSDGGVDVCVGFSDEISYSDAETWSQRYNMYLASGYGVWDSLQYANSYTSYSYNTIYNANLVYSPTADYNMKLGYYANNKSPLNQPEGIVGDYLKKESDKRNIINEISADINEYEITKKEDLYDIMKMVIDHFDVDNYIISENVQQAINVKTNTTIENQIYTFKFKVGDFYTNEGYVVFVQNGKIIALYDNNNYKEVQKELIRNKEKFIVSENEKEKDMQKGKVQYFYDIENDKKYIEVEFRDVNENNEVFIDTIKYEMKG